jgi:hypothetical protein
MHRLDKYPHIKYRSIDHLFWHTYPYKVCLLNEARKRRNPVTWVAHQTSWLDYNRRRREQRVKRKRYLTAIRRVLHAATDYRLINGHHHVMVYFRHEEDAARFIDRAHRRVFEVYRPGSDAQHALLLADHKIKLRPTLFYNRYRWCVVFHAALWNERESELFEWEALYFATPFVEDDDVCDGREMERGFFSVGNQNRLYLRDEKDVILTKLGNSDIIDRIEKVVLVSEVEKNIDESKLEQETCRKGNHPAGH